MTPSPDWTDVVVLVAVEVAAVVASVGGPSAEVAVDAIMTQKIRTVIWSAMEGG